MEQLPDTGNEHQHADKAIDDRRNTGKQTDRRFHDGAEFFWRHFGKKHRRQESDGHAEQDCAAGAINAGENKGENAVFRVGGRRGPLGAEQEFPEADLCDGRQAGQDQIDRDQQYAADRNQS